VQETREYKIAFSISEWKYDVNNSMVCILNIRSPIVLSIVSTLVQRRLILHASTFTLISDPLIPVTQVALLDGGQICLL